MMFSSVTKKWILLFLMALFVFAVNAQKVHFIYLQTEGGRPFYAKFNDKLISSSSEGYIIIPGVTDGEYDLVIGFPRNEFPEEDFKIAVANNNEGYLLKNFGEKGWQLFNMQSLALIAGTSNKSTPVVVKKDEDPFTKMLAGVVKDSSILQDHEVAAVATTKKADTLNKVTLDTTKAMVNEPHNDSKISSTLATSDSVKIKNEVSSSLTMALSPSVNKQDSITRILDKSDKDGLQMIYEVKSDSSKIDTVRIYMPVQKNREDSGHLIPTASENINVASKTDSSQAAIKTTAPNALPQTDPSFKVLPSPTLVDSTIKSNPLANNEKEAVQPPVSQISTIDSTTKAPDSIIVNVGEKKEDTMSAVLLNKSESIKENKDSVSATGNENASQVTISEIAQETTKAKTQDGPPENQLIVLPKVVTTSRVNSDCKNFATDEDFFKLRKKMAAAIDRDDMIKVAKKYFKLKCYSTSQIKDLSYLFLTDEGKYKFFDEAYPFTSDSDQYPTLQSQFTDKYYLNRFRAMIGK